MRQLPLHQLRRHAHGGNYPPSGPKPAVYATDGVGDPEADPRAESEAGPGSLTPVRQPGDAGTIIGSRLSLSSQVFPDCLSHPWPNIHTTTEVGEAVGEGTCPVLACRPILRNQPFTTRSPQGELPRKSAQPW